MKIHKKDKSLELAKSIYTDVYKKTTFSAAKIRIERFKELNTLIKKYGRKDAKTLDFGGGDAELFNYLDKNLDYFIIDIATTHKTNISLNKKKILSFTSNWKVPTKDNFFDVVVLSEVLEHIHNPFSTLQEIKRVLKDKGVLIITVPNAFNLFYIFLSIFGKYIDPSCEHVVLYDYSHLNNLVKVLNFKLIKSYTKFFFLGRIYGKFLFWLDPLFSKLLPHNNMQLFAIFRNKKRI